MGGMWASSVLCSCRRRAARFGDRSARILRTAIIPATPLSLGWFGRCSPARPRNRPRPPRSTTANPRHGSQGPGGPGCRGRTRCDSLSSSAGPVSRHRPWTFSPASFPFGGLRPQYGWRRVSGPEGGSQGNEIHASQSGPRSRDGRYRSQPFPAKALLACMPPKRILVVSGQRRNVE